MSIPILTPLDSPIFDEDVLTEMSEHVDDDVACLVHGCEAAATVRLVFRCCGASGPLCKEHLEVKRFLVAMNPFLVCGYCGRKFLFPGFEQVFRVVTL